MSEPRTDGFWSAEAREGSVTLLRCRGCGHLSRWGDPPCCVSPKGCDPVEYVDLDRLRPIVERMIKDERAKVSAATRAELAEAYEAGRVAGRGDLDAEGRKLAETLALWQECDCEVCQKARVILADSEDERAKALGERRTPDMTWAVIDSLRERAAAALPEVARFTLADIEDAAQALPTGTWPDQSAQHAVLLDQIRDLDAAGRKLAEAGQAVLRCANGVLAGLAEDRDAADAALDEALATWHEALTASPWGDER